MSDERMFARLCVPLDGSPFSDAALGLACGLAAGGTREVIACHAIDPRALAALVPGDAIAYDPGPTLEILRGQGEAILAAAQTYAAAAGVRLTTQLEIADPVAATLKAVDERHADAIVIGTHGRSGFARAMLGSTTEGVLRRATVPVFTVRAGSAAPPSGTLFARALVAVDDSDPSDGAVTLALRLAAAEGMRLGFCTVVETAELLAKSATYGYDPQPLLDDMRIAANDLLDGPLARARESGVAADIITVEGEPATRILAAASAFGARLIVIGSHGRRGLRRFVVGSVAEDVVRTSGVPVLVVRTAS